MMDQRMNYSVIAWLQTDKFYEVFAIVSFHFQSH